MADQLSTNMTAIGEPYMAMASTDSQNEEMSRLSALRVREYDTAGKLSEGSKNATTATDGSGSPTDHEDLSPFPSRLVAFIIASQVLNGVPTVIFAAVGPYIYGYLVGDFQTAGTVSSVATGLSMVIQVMVTPILSQMLDVFGRKPFAIIASIRSTCVVIPLLIAGIVIQSAMSGITPPEDAKDANVKLGYYITNSSEKNLLKFLFGLYWAFALFDSATSSTHSLVAIGDVCQTQRHRTIAIGIYAGLSYTLAAFAVVGAQLSVMVAGCVAVAIGGIAITWAMLMMPETVRDARRRAAAAHVQAHNDNDATATASVDVESVSLHSTDAPLEDSIESLSFVSKLRRIQLKVNPLKGLVLIGESRVSVVALLVLFSCLMAEISASDTLVYYLAITLDFSPGETGYLQMEQAGLSIFFCGLVGPLVAKYVSCARICMMCSFAIAAALLVLALANSSLIVYAVYAPCVGFASIMMPSIAAIVTRNAKAPEDVSLSMSTIMSLVSLLRAAGSFFAALVFKSLPRDYLWVTFVISAAFTLPMFVLSVMLERAFKAEAKEAKEALEGADLQSPLASDN